VRMGVPMRRANGVLIGLVDSNSEVHTAQIPYPSEQGIFSAKQGRRLSSAGANRTRRKERFPARQAQHSAGN
jgi:hypothetical protein